jgi:hypothetical protein
MAEWTPAQQSEFTALYKKYEAMPSYDRDVAYRALFSSELPYGEAKGRLQRLVAGNQGMPPVGAGSGTLEGKVGTEGDRHAGHEKPYGAGSAGKSGSIIKIAALALAGVALLYLGTTYLA